MKFWRDKKGNWIDYKEFSQRLKEGVSNISPLQLTVQQLRGMNIVLIGLLCGIIICLLNIKNLWWLLIILIGSLYVNVTMYIGTWQKKRALENIEKQFSDFDTSELIAELPEPTAYLDLTKEELKGGNKKK